MNKELLKFMLKRSFMTNLVFICTVLVISQCKHLIPRIHPVSIVFNQAVFWMLPYSILLIQKLKGTRKRNSFFFYGGNYTRDEVFLSQLAVVCLSVTLLIFAMLVGETIVANSINNELDIVKIIKGNFIDIIHIVFMVIVLNYQWIRSRHTGQRFSSLLMTLIVYILSLNLLLLAQPKHLTVLLLSVGSPFAVAQIVISLNIHRKMEVTHA